MELLRSQILIYFVVLLTACQYASKAVSVRPCPTNKIAPHRRLARGRHIPRTLGHFYELFSNNDLQNDSPSSLQEEPQEDDPTDCGDIEDYDETDLSSITPQAQRKGGSRESRLFFSHTQNQNRPPYYPGPQGPYPGQGGNYPNQGGHYPNQGGNYLTQGGNYPNQGGNYPNQGVNYLNQGGDYPNRPPPSYPVRPTRPPPFRPQRPGYPPVRPPYSSGGVFSDNPYRPQHQQNPSEGLKPVYEGTPEPSAPYRPGVVGGPISHIAGHLPAPARPTPPAHVDDIQQTRRPTNQVVFERPAASDRPRQHTNRGIFGSFLDLFFK